MDNFTVWLIEELNKRDWIPATLAKRARINSGNLSHILNGDRKPSVDTILAIARALNLSPESVLRQAGILPPKPELDERTKEASHLFQQLGEKEQRLALATLRSWCELER